MIQLAHEEIYPGQYATLERQIEQVVSVTPEQVAEAARHCLDPTRFALTALGPTPDGPITEADWPVAG